MKLIQIFLVRGLVLVGYSYTEENHVLILTADDFPGIIEEFPHILIEFYAPWYVIVHSGADTAKDLPPFMMKLPKNSMIQEFQVKLMKFSPIG